MKRVVHFVHGFFMPLPERGIPLVILLMLFGLFSVQAAGNQDLLEKKVSLRLNKVSLTDAIKQIEIAAQTNFFFDQKILNGRKDLISFNVKNAPLKTILAQVFPLNRYEFFQLESQIVVKQKAAYKPVQTVNNDYGARAEITISGTVKSEAQNLALDGVTIKALPSQKITVTNNAGFFKIEANIGDSLEFTYVGYQRQVIIIRDRIVLDVQMAATEGGLNEVVVVGFGKQKKISLVGAQSTVNVEELKQPVANLSTSLAGRIAGVVGVQRTGEPGRNGADIWIRGIATFNSDNDASPLILIDGVPRDINSLDPEDIQSVTVLKDASATAVYGVQGANGVVIIKTKSGKAGKATFNANYNEGFVTFTRIPQLTDGITYMNLTNEAMIASGRQPKYTQEYIDKTASGEDPYVYPNVDWMDALFNKWSNNRRLNVSSRGGSERANYYVSLAYYDEKGFLKTDGLESYNTDTRFRRYNFTSNLNLQLTNSTKFELGIQGYITNTNYPGVTSSTAFAQAMQITPVLFPVMYPGGYVPGQSSNGDQRNPYADITKRGYQSIYGNQLYTNARLTQDLAFVTPGLTITGMYSFDTHNSQTLSRTKRESTYYVDQTTPRNEDGTLNLVQTWAGDNTLSYSNSNGGTRAFYTEASLNYDREFGIHHISGMLLFNQRDYKDAFAGDLISSIPYRYRGLAGRGTYSFRDKYFAEVNFGYNGSENFAPSKRYGFFPSIGLGWVLSAESFFKPLKDYIQFFKLRYSDGLVGAGSGGRRFGYLTFVSGDATGYTYGTNREAGRGGIEITDYGTEITWSTSHKRDLGIEFKTFNSRLSVILDLFTERRKGVFLERGSLASFVGLTNNPYGNLGVMDNKGIDMTVEAGKFYIGKVALTFRGNLTYNKDKVIENDQPTPKYPWLEKRGHNYLSRFGLVAEGLFQSEEEITKSATSSFGSVRVGDIKYKDLNGDNVIDSYDRTRIGRGDVPAWVYGFGFNIEYKRFYFSTFFQGTAQVDRLLSGDGIIPFSNSTGADRSNLYAVATDRWTEENPKTNPFYPRLAYGNSENKHNIQESTWWVKDISFIRLKTMEIGYDLPVKGLAPIGVKRATLFAQGSNILTFSKFKLWDPELNTSNGTTYPNVMTISVGIQANF